MRRTIIITATAATLAAGCASSRVLVPWGGDIPDTATRVDQVLEDGSQASRDYCDHYGGRVVVHPDGTVVCEDMDT